MDDYPNYYERGTLTLGVHRAPNGFFFKWFCVCHDRTIGAESRSTARSIWYDYRRKMQWDGYRIVNGRLVK